MEPSKNWEAAPKSKVSDSKEKPLHILHPDDPLAVKPTVVWVIASWTLALLFILAARGFFAWLPPHAHEMVRHLKGFPSEWADLFLRWSECFLDFAVILSAAVHTAWRATTRYVITDKGLEIRSLFPERRVELVPYSSVDRTGLHQSLMGWALDYGHVEVDLGGARGPVVLRNCPKPEAFLKELQRRLEG